MGRNLRLTLLLLMLASQCIASVHELDTGHPLDSHPCSICVIGHAGGAAIGAHAEEPQLQIHRAWIPSSATGDVLVSHNDYYRTRAPPATL